jgi:hypothetical protein
MIISFFIVSRLQLQERRACSIQLELIQLELEGLNGKIEKYRREMFFDIIVVKE